jgi:hypothetical protein
VLKFIGLVVWMFTVGVGTYMLATHTKPGRTSGAEPVPIPIPVPASEEEAKKVMFDPPSLARNKAEPLPGGRALAEFLHPMLGISGFAAFLMFIFAGDTFFGLIALGLVLGAIVVGLVWAFVNIRGVRQDPIEKDAMSFSPRVLLLHAAGAAATVLMAVLLVARV